MTDRSPLLSTLRDTIARASAGSGNLAWLDRLYRRHTGLHGKTCPQWLDRTIRWFENRTSRIVAGWIVLVVAIAAIKAATAPTPPADIWQMLGVTLPFLLVAAAPVLGYRIGSKAFSTPAAMDQPMVRLAHYGAWRPASQSEIEAARTRWPGLAWFSLVSGILLNVPFRALEYLTSIPAVTPAAPAWAHAITQAFTLDCALMCFIYAACFAAAVQRSPLFPRALIAAWVVDVVLQGVIAMHVAAAPGLPSMLVDPMVMLLQTNLNKVAISSAIWLPYLLVSENVNLHLRHRVRISALPA